ncbi:MAG: diguanylate cyclase, partial [Bacteroidota bacterium]
MNEKISKDDLKITNEDNHSWQEMSVLVVDDEEHIRELVMHSVQHKGGKADHASNGQDGLQKLLNDNFDILVVDMRMARMDGVMFIREALNIWPWMGVVVITGYNTSEAMENLQDMGVKRVLEKPFAMDVLLSEIAQEYAEKYEESKEFRKVSLASMQRQLQILRLITEPVLQENTFLDASKGLTARLSEFLNFSVVGLLYMEDNPLAIFNVSESISQNFLDTLLAEMKERYLALSGQPLAGDVRSEIEGMETSGNGYKEAEFSFYVPIMSGANIRGLLILASGEQPECDVSELSFIYHVANHLSTVFTALGRMRQLAITDNMTGLYNRLHLESQLNHMWERIKRYRRDLSVVLMDIDHFKTLNDTLGHMQGDEVLKEFAQILSEEARAADIVGRYGGEEFVVILPETDRKDATVYAERLLKKIRDHVFCKDTNEIHLTVSMGISSINGEDEVNIEPDDLLEYADKAMYLAKNAGRNCIRSWADHHEKSVQQAQEKDKVVKTFYPETNQNLKGTVLIADDDEAVREMLSAILRKEGFLVNNVECGEDAVYMVQKEPLKYDILLADLHMPGIDGFELVQSVKAIDDTVVNIIITGNATLDNAVKSMREGTFDFIQKPCTYDQVCVVLQRAIEYRRTLLENRHYQQYLAQIVREKSQKATEALKEVKASYEFTLEALVGLLDAREKSAGEHSKRVRELTVTLAKKLGIEGEQLEHISRGALLHDIGKIGIPDRILLKPTDLTAKEKEVMKKHPTLGFNILSGSAYLAAAAEIVYEHQEKYNGTGYPRGLKGDEICMGARL